MSEPSKAEGRALNRNLNWLRKHGTKAQKDATKGSGFCRMPDGPKGQVKRMTGILPRTQKRMTKGTGGWKGCAWEGEI